jgi:shikimate dehydrogenase
VADRYRLDPSLDNYCVIGNPVSHSKSPLIHHAFARQTGQDILYQAVLVEIGGLQSFLQVFQEQGGKGLNVTIPFKGDAWQAMDLSTSRAAIAESVNTIWFTEDGRRHGDTTDGCGLVRDLRNNNIEPENKRILILGAGGAVRGVLKDLIDCGPAGITIANRTHSRAVELVRRFSEAPNLKALPLQELGSAQYELVINGTSASLERQQLSLPETILAPAACCYDMVYSDTDTVFVEWAKHHGAAIAVDGLGMLVEQAAESFFIWRGIRPDTMPVIKMLRNG